MPPPGFGPDDFSVVITTRNRRHVVARAIVSAMTQDVGTPEVVVVDDASTDGTSRYVARAFPTVRLHRVSTQGGCGPGRNVGLRLASRRWVVILDDDDELRPDALKTIGLRVAAFPHWERYPVFKFRRSDSILTVPFQLSRVPNLWAKDRQGVFISAWNRELALSEGCRYPEHRLSAEGLLWIDMAARFGLPTWADCVCTMHSDAGTRMTAPEAEVRDAAELAQIEDGFVTLLLPHASDERVHQVVTERIVLSGVYSLLAGRRREALRRGWKVIRRRPLAALKLIVGSAVPRWVVLRRFRSRRRREDVAVTPTVDTGWA
jgi:glycosyltransferase involved in cell wall biosynthesis